MPRTAAIGIVRDRQLLADSGHRRTFASGPKRTLHRPNKSPAEAGPVATRIDLLLALAPTRKSESGEAEQRERGGFGDGAGSCGYVKNDGCSADSDEHPIRRAGE